MAKIIIISGSPSHPSRSSAIADYLEGHIETKGFQVKKVTLRDLPAGDLALANFNNPVLKQALQHVEEAQGVIVVSPIYKASYPGLLKSFLDLLPEKGLENKVVLPIATGGTIAHLLSLEYAFKPVFSVLGAREILHGVYLTDSQISYKEQGLTFAEKNLEQRIKASLEQLLQYLTRKETAPFQTVN